MSHHDLKAKCNQPVLSYSETYQTMVNVGSNSPPEFENYSSKKTAYKSIIIIINICFPLTKYFHIQFVLTTLQFIYDYISN